MFTEIPAPATMQALVLAELAKSDSPVRGSTVQAAVGAMLAPEAKALMQNPRANGRQESQWQNALYRAVRQLKAHGLVTGQGNLWGLTAEGLAKAKADS